MSKVRVNTLATVDDLIEVEVSSIADQTDITAAKDRSNHTGTQPASTISDFKEAAKGATGYDSSNTVNFQAALFGKYWLASSLTVTLPNTSVDTPLGSSVTFVKALTATPIIQVGAGGANIVTTKGTDTSVIFNINAEIVFVFNGTNWEI